MLTPRIRAALVVLAASAGLSACTSLGPYGGVGVGVSSGYGSYGYGQYGYDPYYAGYGYGSGYGSAFGYDPFGWYGGYYYPGSGNYCYDRNRNRHELTPEQRAYWMERMRNYLRTHHGTAGTTATAAIKENWTGFNRPSGVTVTNDAAVSTDASVVGGREAVRQRLVERQQVQQQARVERQQVQSERQQARSERFEARQQAISEQREARRPRRESPDE